MTLQLIDKLQQSLQQDSQIAIDSNLMVAISGGADSLALLHGLAALRKRFSFVIHAATLNHGLRDAAADDVTFVREFAETLHIPVTTGQVNVPNLARGWKMSIEAAARHARYHFLAGVAQQVGAAAIVTAHHADDQAETVLMHLLRGSGLNGLQGMRYASPVPDYPKLRLLRPMLNITRAEILAYCAEHDLQPRHDETNDDTTLLRNKIRLEILPHLAQVNPNISGALTRLAEVVKVEQDYMQQQFEREVLPHIQQSHNWLSLPLDVFRRLHPAMQRYFVMFAAMAMQSPVELQYERVIEALMAAKNKKTGKIIQLGDGFQLRLEYERVVLEMDASRIRYAKPLSDYPLKVAGYEDYPVTYGAGTYWIDVPGYSTLTGLWIIRATYEAHENFQARIAVPQHAEIVIRQRQPGDRFKPLGMGGKSQKLKDWLINHKVPQPVRDFLPLLVINDEIAAIVVRDKWTVSETFAVSENSDRIGYFSVINTVAISEQS